MIGYSTAGIIMLLVCVGYVENSRNFIIPQWLVVVGNLCFGVYLFQQFILQALYYNTNMPVEIGAIATPWCGFAIALVGSLLLTWLIRVTKLGRAIL